MFANRDELLDEPLDGDLDAAVDGERVVLHVDVLLVVQLARHAAVLEGLDAAATPHVSLQPSHVRLEHVLAGDQNALQRVLHRRLALLQRVLRLTAPRSDHSRVGHSLAAFLHILHHDLVDVVHAVALQAVLRRDVAADDRRRLDDQRDGRELAAAEPSVRHQLLLLLFRQRLQ